jgi:hypothetical protein
MKTTRKIAKGLSMLCLVGLIGIGLNLHVCSVEKALVKSSSTSKCKDSTSNSAATQPGFVCEETASSCIAKTNGQTESTSAMPADLGITRILTPIISQYLAEFLPRLVH